MPLENFWLGEMRLWISGQDGGKKWNPSTLTLRDNLEADFIEQTKHWIDVYNVVLAVGEMFANHTADDPKRKITIENEETHETNDKIDQRFRPLTLEPSLNKCWVNVFGGQQFGDTVLFSS